MKGEPLRDRTSTAETTPCTPHNAQHLGCKGARLSRARPFVRRTRLLIIVCVDWTRVLIIVCVDW